MITKTQNKKRIIKEENYNIKTLLLEECKKIDNKNEKIAKDFFEFLANYLDENILIDNNCYLPTSCNSCYIYEDEKTFSLYEIIGGLRFITFREETDKEFESRIKAEEKAKQRYALIAEKNKLRKIEKERSKLESEKRQYLKLKEKFEKLDIVNSEIDKK